MLTDGQSMGWRWITGPGGMLWWRASKPCPPARRSLSRKFPLPATFRNAAIAGIRYSREVIGTDRPVSIEVTVENTGSEAITPAGVELIIGDKTLKDSGIGQLAPGAVKQCVLCISSRNREAI